MILYYRNIEHRYGASPPPIERRHLLTQITGDTKAGTFIGADRYGNKYYENMQEELPRTFAFFPGYMSFVWIGLIVPCSPDALGRLQGVRLRRIAD